MKLRRTIEQIYFVAVFSLLCLGGEALQAQNGEEYVFRRMSRADGLASDEVFSIYQDHQGIMWFGTSNGLCSYNGITFTVFQHREGDSTSIPQNLITCITEDKSGNLWVGTKEYICRFVPRGDGGTFMSFRLPTRVGFDLVRAIVDDGEHLLYIQHGVGLSVVDKRTFAVRSILDERDLGKDPEISSTLIDDKRGRLWIASVKGLFVYDTRTKHLRKVYSTTRIAGTMSRLDLGGLLWFNDDVCLYGFDPQTERIVRSFPRPPRQETAAKLLASLKSIYFLGQSLDSLIWLQSNRTVWAFNPRTGAMRQHTREVQNALQNSGVFCGFTDRTGGLWFGDDARGIAVWSPYKPKFRLWRHNPLNPTKSLSNDYIRGIWDDGRGTAWVCTQYGGLNRIQPTSGDIQHYRSENSRVERKGSRAANSSTSLQSDDLWGVLPAKVDSAGRQRTIWVYKETFYCQELDVQTGRFRSIPIRPTVLMFCDRDGDFWTADHKGNGGVFIGKVAADGTRFLPQKQMTKATGRIDAMLHDRRRNRLWFALHEPRIIRFDKSLRLWDTLRLTPLPHSSDYFCSMMQDHAGSVWIATKGDGIYICDTNDRVRTITEKDGLLNRNIYGMFEDANGVVWLSCDNGILRYDPATKRLRQYTPDDGLQGWEFNRMAFYQTMQGYIYFGGINGLNYFHPDNVRDNPFPPPVVLTSVKIFDKPLKEIGFSLRLPFDKNTLSFEFAALDFTAPELNKYSWKLEGFESEWSSATAKHETKYTNLAPGDYVFRLKACNSDGLWNEAGISLPIVIEPAWYQTWWFQLLCVLGLIVGIAVLVRWRVRVVELRNRQLEVQVHKRTKELREANGEIQRQLEIQDAQAREIEMTNSELDVTLQNLKSAQTQLVQSERMNAIGMLTAGVMHEINNPTSITYSAIAQTRTKLQEMSEYFLSLLDDESKASAEVQKYQELSNDALSRLELAADGASRVKTIVANLQGMTKHQEEGGKPGNLIVELASTFSLFRMQFNNVEIIAHTPPEGIFLKANFGEINQVFLNLLVNAAQAGATRITLTATQTETTATLRMSDDGKGMPQETAERIFEPFFTTKSVGNSGLGLSISKQIIERHGGILLCESEIGQGTTFIVELPTSSQKAVTEHH